MTNTQTISEMGRLPGFFEKNNVYYIQQKIAEKSLRENHMKKVVVPIDNIEGVMIYVHEKWGRRTMTLEQLNDEVVEQIWDMYKSHIHKIKVDNYLLNNEAELRTKIKSTQSYKMNPRAREVQFQYTF